MAKTRERRRREASERVPAVAAKARRSEEGRKDLLICVVLVAIVLIGYCRVASLDFTKFDDNVYVTDNAHVQQGLTGTSLAWTFQSGYAANWHPLTWISHMADWEMFGASPKGPHLENVLFHIANTLLLFVILTLITGYRWRSAFVAALFAVHPLHVESVAWVVERKDVLSTFLMMLTILAYVRYVKSPGIARYSLVLLAFALGLMAKPMLVTLPLVLLLLDYWPLRRLRISGFELRIAEKAPLLVLSVASSALTYIAQKQGGAVRTLEVFPLGIRVANALVAYVKYAWKMIWPSGLGAYYPHPRGTLSIWEVAGATLLLACITALALIQARRRPYLAVGWLWYVVTLIPVIGFVQVGTQAMADRYTYIPLIGLFVILAWGIPDLLLKPSGSKSTPNEAHAQIMGGLGVGVLLVFTAMTYVQVGYWRDTITLFTRALAVTSNNALANNNLGRALFDAGRRDEALEHYKEALRIDPKCLDAHFNMAVYDSEKGNDKSAEAEYRKVLEINSKHAQANNNLGVILGHRGLVDDAIAHYRTAVEAQPEYADARFNLALTLHGQGKVDEAAKHYAIYLEARPDNWSAQFNYGLILAERGDQAEAIRRFREALRVNPDYAPAHYRLGLALQESASFSEAASEYEQTLRLDPNNADAQANLARALAAAGRH